MASIPTPSPGNLTFPSHQFPSFKRSFYYPPARFPDSTLCRCSDNSFDNNSVSWRWDSAVVDVIKSAVKRFDSYLNPFRKHLAESDGVSENRRRRREEEGDWDWDRWKKHFEQVDEQERLLSLLKAQLYEAVCKEDYEDAARLKVAIAAASTNDTVGRTMSHLNKAVVEERFEDAAFLRDTAGTGLVGWWAGLSDDTKDPHGLIIRITAEHGRYVARSFSPRQLTTASVGMPLFEIFLTENKKGEYKQQAVYLKKRRVFPDPSKVSSKTSGATSRRGPSVSSEDKSDVFVNLLQDMIPGVKVKVLKVSAPGKVDQDFISKVIEQTIDEEDEDKDAEVESIELDDELKSENDHERDQFEMDVDSGFIDSDKQGEIAVKVVVGGLVEKLSGCVPALDLVRVPAKLVKKGQLTFSFSIEEDINQQDSSLKTKGSTDRKPKAQSQRSIDNIMFDLAKFIGSGRDKIPLKLLKDVGELINLTLNQAQNHQPLSGSTTFHRIETAASPDPLNGLYVGAHGLYTSEVIHLRRKFGQWQENSGTKEPSDLEFYEYVEAVKLTGDPYVPAGQVAFRARVGKRYQLPHKGIIPEEFGVVARYKGQGRLAEPGFRNPRWVDGELVILDGKYIKGGPVVGFVYWAPEYHFLVFFNRLRLQP
ncbi:protein EXECUTER 1, chloroplastic-like [Gossypium australe]|uniref:Protein EXECUTER 1, chloroplastic-like n=1 Tax=Gossypium australe TaxID=47621 RepID=A0A5B6X612_9ROSI|nr:protein EXECUTER 1, chloroplastic-like [Gossypium australe]